MSLADFIQRKIVQSRRGSLFSSGFGKKRRDILFFEEILANYFQMCEKAGFEKEMEELAGDWMTIMINAYAPSVVKVLPLESCINLLLERLWKKIGILEKCHAKKSGENTIIETKGEPFVRFIGENSFSKGLFTGVVEAYYLKKANLVNLDWNGTGGVYTIALGNEKIDLALKDKKEYYWLNTMRPNKKQSLEELIRAGAVSLRKNRVFYLGKKMFIMETSLPHLIAQKGVKLELLARASEDFFKTKLSKSREFNGGFRHAKLLFQLNGFGEVDILQNGKSLSVNIRHPPYGMQLAKDKWDFIAQYILGYLRAMDNSFKFVGSKEFSRKLILSYKSG